MFSLLPCPLLQKDVARCSVLHFSWFLVVSRLVQNECKVSTEGTLLFSSVDPNIKVTFPPGVTEETRSVKLQVCMPKKGSPGQPLVQLLTYVKQQNTRWNVCSRVSSVLTWMPHGLTHLLALSALVFLPAKWAVLQAAPLWESGFPCGAPPCRSARRHHEEKYHLLLVPLQNTLSLAEQLSKRDLQRLFMQI